MVNGIYPKTGIATQLEYSKSLKDFKIWPEQDPGVYSKQMSEALQITTSVQILCFMPHPKQYTQLQQCRPKFWEDITPAGTWGEKKWKK